MFFCFIISLSVFIGFPPPHSHTLLQELDISCTPGQRRKWLFVWLVKLGDDDNLPFCLPDTHTRTHLIIFPSVCLSLHLSVCLSVGLSLALHCLIDISARRLLQCDWNRGPQCGGFTQDKYPGSSVT